MTSALSPRLGGEAFAPSGEAHAFGGGGFDADAVHAEIQYLRDARAHRLAVGTNLGPLADQGDVAMKDLSAFGFHQAGGMVQEFPRRRAAPTFIRRRKMLADVAFAIAPRMASVKACRPASASEWPSRP